jgi:hypothetical protein
LATAALDRAATVLGQREVQKLKSIISGKIKRGNISGFNVHVMKTYDE